MGPGQGSAEAPGQPRTRPRRCPASVRASQTPAIIGDNNGLLPGAPLGGPNSPHSAAARGDTAVALSARCIVTPYRQGHVVHELSGLSPGIVPGSRGASEVHPGSEVG